MGVELGIWFYLELFSRRCSELFTPLLGEKLYQRGQFDALAGSDCDGLAKNQTADNFAVQLLIEILFLLVSFARTHPANGSFLSHRGLRVERDATIVC